MASPYHSVSCTSLIGLYNLGNIYYNLGGEKDITKAVYLSKKAAKQNNTEAQYQLGNIYYYGKRFISFYYKYGPRLANMISANNLLKLMFKPIVNTGVAVIKKFKLVDKKSPNYLHEKFPENTFVSLWASLFKLCR